MLRTSRNICVKKLQDSTISLIVLFAQQDNNIVKVGASVNVHDRDLRDHMVRCLRRKVWEQVLIENILSDVPRK